MPFKKGFDPGRNLRGRPPVGESLAEYIRKLGGPEGKRWVAILDQLATEPHSNPAVRLGAIQMLLERGWGRTPQEMVLPAGADGLSVTITYTRLASGVPGTADKKRK